MGRPPRRSGHTAGTFPQPKIAARADTTGGSRPSALSQPRQPQPSQAAPSYQQNLQLDSSQYPQRGLVLGPQTPSTTDAVSPVSSRATLSPNLVSAGYNAAFGYDSYLPPDAGTPDSSTSTFSRNNEQYYHSHGPQLAAQTTAYGNEYVMSESHGLNQDVMGIEYRVLSQETEPFIASSPRFVSLKNSSPIRLQQFPRSINPWDGQTLRQDSLPGGLETTYDVMEWSPDNAQAQIQASRARGAGRHGPLQPRTRENACEVRKHGACLRCSIMKEGCDTQSPCTSCSSKDRRKAPKPCIPRQFDWESYESTLFPGELKESLRTNNVFRYIKNSSFAMSPRPSFPIELDIGIGRPLNFLVKEFHPLDSAAEIRHAHQTRENQGGNRSSGLLPTWNPPIIVCINGESHLEQEANTMRMKIVQLLDQQLSDHSAWAAWTWKYFPGNEQDFQAEILQLIGHYYRRDLDEHSVLRHALSLLWFEYLLMVKFSIPQETWPYLEDNMTARRPAGLSHAIPDMINRFLKAIIMPMAMKAAQKLTEALHDLLFKLAHRPETSTRGRSDLALCLLLILNIYLGRTEATLIMLADTPRKETGKAYFLSDAAATIRNMERIGDHFTSLHQYTLKRRCKKMVAAHVDSDFETHAKDRDLCGSLQEVMLKFAHEKPRSFEVGVLGDGFRCLNVQRLCWRILNDLGKHR